MVSLTPLFFNNLPPLLDYPNHLARAVALAASGTNDPAAQIYAARWGIIPNLGSDVILQPLLWFLPPLVAGRIFLAIVIATVIVGIVLFARAAFGVWTIWSIIGAPVAAYSGLFLMGFLNFCLASGLALGVAALWMSQREIRPQVAIAGTAGGLTMIWFCHFAGVIFGTLLIMAYEAWRIAEQRSVASMIHEALRRAPALIVICLPAVFLYAASDFSSTDTVMRWSWQRKPWRLMLPVAGYFPTIDIIMVLAVVGTLAFSAFSHRLKLYWPGAMVLAVCMLAFIASPHAAKGGAWIDTRFAAMAWLLAFASFAPRFDNAVERAALFVVVASATLRFWSIETVWARTQSDINDVRTALSCAPPLSRVLVVLAEPRSSEIYPKISFVKDPIYNHLGALALIDRRAFWPSMFSQVGQQPIRVLPPFDSLRRSTPPPTIPKLLLDWRWAGRFDFILLLGSTDGETLPKLDVHCTTDYARLIRVPGSDQPQLSTAPQR